MKTEGLSLSLEAISALERGNKIEAIKLVRQMHKCGLKEAKDAVEFYLESNPDAGRTYAANTKANKGLYWLAFFIIAGVMIFLVFSGML